MRGFFGLVVVLCVRTHPIRRVNVGFDRWGRTSRLLFAQPRLERIPCRSSRYPINRVSFRMRGFIRGPCHFGGLKPIIFMLDLALSGM
eukprot:1370982-Amorphochlora_amoeboformis.AAC.1